MTWSYQDTTISGQKYRLYSGTGLENDYQPGFPQMPVRILSFSVPYNATNICVNAVNTSGVTSNVNNFQILPAPEIVSFEDYDVTNTYIPDSVIYHTNAFYPVAARKLREGMHMGENHFVTVAVAPLQFNPVTRKVRLNTSVSFSITYQQEDSVISYLLLCADTLMRQRAWGELAAMVTNPNDVQANALSQSAVESIYAQNNLGAGEDCVYMIVTPQSLAHAYRRILALKRQKGISAGIRCIEDILSDQRVQFGDSVPGAPFTITDDAGKLRQYLRLSYQSNKTRYVLLGGYGVPVRTGYHGDVFKNGVKHVPTDLYFSDLQTNWNNNNNGDYGEYTEYIDSIYRFDSNSSLMVGRLMAKMESEVNHYTDKLLLYELNPGGKNKNGAYLNHAHIFEGLKGGNAQSMGAYMDMFSQVAYTIEWSDSFGYYPTGSDVINSLNSMPCGYVSLMGHGSPMQLTTNSLNNVWHHTISTLESVASEPGSGLDCLTNKGRPFVGYSQGCSTIPFNDWPNPNSSRPHMRQYNIGQSLTLGKDYGAVAFFGNTASGILHYTDKLEQRFPLVYGNYYQFGQLMTQIRLEYIKSTTQTELGKQNYPLYTIMTHNLMGDPECPMRTKNPYEFGDIMVTRTNNGISISGLPSNTIIGCCDNEGTTLQYGVPNTGESSVSLNVSPNSTVMVYDGSKVYKNNLTQHIPYIAPLLLQNTTIGNSQYVIANDVVAGNHVDIGRTAGDVTISAGVEYEIEHKGTVTLNRGFKVEKGATFSVRQSVF